MLVQIQRIITYLKSHPLRFKALLAVFWKLSPVWMLGVLGALLAYKYYQNKRIRVFCKNTKRNQEILRVMQPRIKEYSPTVYLPLGVFKCAVVAATKMSTFHDYMRMEVTLSDGELIPLDWFPRNYEELSPDIPIVFFVPGIFGTSLEGYSIECCRMFYKSLGWRTFVFNRRSFLTQLRGDKVISYSHFQDWREILTLLKSKFPQAPIFMVGVSMGAVNIQRYLGEFAHDPMVVAAVTISSPWDTSKTSDAVNADPIIAKAMHAELMFMFKSQLHQKQFVNLCQQKGIDIQKVLQSKSWREFDWLFSSVETGFTNTEDYYGWLSSHLVVDKISVPVLSLNSEDDPVVPMSAIPFERIKRNPNVIQLLVAGAGHIEYYHGMNLEFWAYALGIDFLQNIRRVMREYPLNDVHQSIETKYSVNDLQALEFTKRA